MVLKEDVFLVLYSGCYPTILQLPVGSYDCLALYIVCLILDLFACIALL